MERCKEVSWEGETNTLHRFDKGGIKKEHAHGSGGRGGQGLGCKKTDWSGVSSYKPEDTRGADLPSFMCLPEEGPSKCDIPGDHPGGGGCPGNGCGHLTTLCAGETTPGMQVPGKLEKEVRVVGGT